MKKLRLITLILICLSTAACGVYDEEMKADTEPALNEVEYTKEIYLIETANDVRAIRSLHDKLIVHLAEETDPLDVFVTLMEMSIEATDQSYQLPATDSLSFSLIRDDLQEIQSYVDEKRTVFADQKELDRLSLNQTITHLDSLIDKLESDFQATR